MTRKFRATVRLAEGGRVVIPSEVRDRLGMEVGSTLVMTVEGDHATLASAKAARVRARRRVQRYVRSGESLSRELMGDRKREAASE